MAEANSTRSTKRRVASKRDPKLMTFAQIGRLPKDEFPDAFFAKLDGETEPILTDVQVNKIESIINDNGTMQGRRAGLAYLSMPFPETTKKIEGNREFAVALANAQVVIKGAAQHYEYLAELLNAASTRILLALCSRPDMEEVVKEGKRDAEEAAEEDI